MANFDFEFIITGMCFLEFDDRITPSKCTVRIPRAEKVPFTFADEFGINSEKVPVPHHQILSFPTRFQVSNASGRRRPPDRVVPAPDGDELGICILNRNETFDLKIFGASPPLTTSGPLYPPNGVPAAGEEGDFRWTASLDEFLKAGGFSSGGIDLN